MEDNYMAQQLDHCGPSKKAVEMPMAMKMKAEKPDNRIRLAQSL